jgi:hypothetical protein
LWNLSGSYIHPVKYKNLPIAAKAGSAGLLAGCRVDLPVHAAIRANRKTLYFG